MYVAVGILIILVGAIALAAAYKLIDSFVLAAILELLRLAAVISIFLWLR